MLGELVDQISALPPLRQVAATAALIACFAGMLAFHLATSLLWAAGGIVVAIIAGAATHLLTQQNTETAKSMDRRGESVDSE